MHRDPNTGKFVAGTGPGHYSDYEFQHVVSSYQINAADLPGAFPVSESDVNIVSLDDLLDRDERADLVAVDIHALQAAIPGTSSAESGLYARFELRAGVGDELVTDADADITQDTGESGVVDKVVWRSDSPDVLYFAHWNADAGFADTAGGVGGGADQPIITADVHYPREYGSCPQFDDRDEITESFYLTDQGGASIEDSLVELNVSYTLVFSVYDRD